MSQTKRIRSSQSRDARYYSAAQSIAVQWRDAFRKHEPLHVTHERISTWIRSLDVTVTQRASLSDKHWAMREYAVTALSRWQLYLDGVPRTFDEIAAIAAAAETAVQHLGKGPTHAAHLAVMRRICGRHEWENSHDPFYADEQPGNLNQSTKRTAETSANVPS